MAMGSEVKFDGGVHGELLKNAFEARQQHNLHFHFGPATEKRHHGTSLDIYEVMHANQLLYLSWHTPCAVY